MTMEAAKDDKIILEGLAFLAFSAILTFWASVVVVVVGGGVGVAGVTVC
jgi:hypothetical protein